MKNNEKVKFGVFADLHVDIMHDALTRLTIFLDTCKKENVDFIIQLGDFCYPDENRYVTCKAENTPINIKNALKSKPSKNMKKILDLFNEYPAPKYHVLGNHDMDFCSKEEMLEYLGCKNAYYSFDCKNYHFVVLDANFLKVDGQYHSYDHGNYFDYPKEIPYLDEEQLSWLSNDLEQTDKTTVIFSHQSLNNELYGVKNYESFRKILSKENNKGKKVLMCINGHNHIDNLVEEEEVFYFNLNSISNVWIGEKYSSVRYSAEIDTQYPNIRYTAPYKDPIYAIISMDESGIEVEGKESDFVGKSPYELGVPLSVSEAKFTPKVSSFKINT